MRINYGMSKWKCYKTRIIRKELNPWDSIVLYYAFGIQGPEGRETFCLKLSETNFEGF